MKKRYLIPVIVLVISAVLTVTARLCRPFADFYANNIFPVISTPFAWLSGRVPFSVGEIMIICGILLVVVGLPLLIVLLIVRKKKWMSTLCGALTVCLWVLAYIGGTETLNCFMLYGCTRFSERYFPQGEHTRSELVELYGMLIDETNELAMQVPRDKDDRFELTIDPEIECKKAMHKAAESYPQLSGYYPPPKPIKFSYFMSQMDLLGMYIPFSMESNYNNDMVRTNLPDTICHEYAHLKGFIQEDEASFVAFAATFQSDDPQVRYSGFLDALAYVRNQIVKNDITEAEEYTEKISEQVKRDWYRFLPDTYWEDNKQKEVFDTETVNTVSEAAADASLKMNGVEDGIESYSRMVNLLLDYFYPSQK